MKNTEGVVIGLSSNIISKPVGPQLARIAVCIAAFKESPPLEIQSGPLTDQPFPGRLENLLEILHLLGPLLQRLCGAGSQHGRRQSLRAQGQQPGANTAPEKPLGRCGARVGASFGQFEGV